MTRFLRQLRRMFLPLLAALAVLSAPACNTTPTKTPAALGSQAAQATRLAFTGASLLTQKLADLNAAWMHTIVATGDPAIADAAASTERKLTAAIDESAVILAKVRPMLSNGAGEAAIRKELRGLLPLLKSALDLLDGIGRPPPKEIGEGFDFLAGFLAGFLDEGGAS